MINDCFDSISIKVYTSGEKLYLIFMKGLVLLLCTLVNPFMAIESWTQHSDNELTINSGRILSEAPDSAIVKDSTFSSFSDLIQFLEKRFSVKIYFKEEWIPTDIPLVVEDSEILSDFLDQLSGNSELAYWLLNEYSIILAPENRINFLEKKEINEGSLTEKKGSGRYNILGNPDFPSDKQRVSINGIVIDPITEKPIAGTEIIIDSLRYSIFSDATGYFSFSVPIGYHSLTIRATGYANMKEYLRIYDDADWNIEMDMEAYRLPEVLLQAQASDNNVQNIVTGLLQLNIKEIKRLPAFLGETDVLQAVLALPGVNSVGEGTSGFNVRGGGIDQNLVLLNEGILFNASHALGFLSIFPPDLVEGVDLYKGFIPARYGGRLSSVMNVKMKTGNNDRLRLNGGVGFIGNRLALDGPFFSKNTTFAVGLRSSYSDWFLDLVEDPDVKNSEAWYGDVYASMTRRWNDKHITTASAFVSRDRFQFSDEFGFTWNSGLAELNWKYLISGKLSLSSSGVWGNYTSTNFELSGSSAFTLTNELTYYKLSQFLIWEPNRDIQIQAGWEGIRYQTEPEELNPRGSESDIVPGRVEKDDGREVATFVEATLKPNSRLAFSLGLRASFFQAIGPKELFIFEEGVPRSASSVSDTIFFDRGEKVKSYDGLEPRFSLRANLDDKTSLKLSYNRVYQYIHLISNTAASTPVDIWQVSNTDISPQYVDQLSLGLFRNFSQNTWETSIELYYKWLEGTKEFKNFAQLFQNPVLEADIVEGTGRAYGVELLIKRNLGRTKGWLAYAFARSERQVLGEFREETINGGDWFPANFDQPHQITFNLSHDINRRNSLAINFTYRSGRPVTAPVGDYVIDGVLIPHYSLRNQFRIPDYHRLDLSYTLGLQNIKRKRFRNSFTFAVYNLYGRRNAFSVFFRRDTGRLQVPRAFQLSILGSVFPSITYNFSY